MGETDAIEKVDEPVTVSAIVEDCRELGLEPGDTVLVHASLSELGWVSGGAQAVVQALQQTVTQAGTVVVPTHTPQYLDPSEWHAPPVPDDWYETIRETRPPYRPEVTPTRGVGAIPECFRNVPGALRSGHPQFSFAAWGADAEAIVTDHAIDHGLGERSPLARLYERDGSVLLLGVGHSINTSLHLAEYRADLDHETVEGNYPVVRDGERVALHYEDIETSTDDFDAVGADFEDAAGCREGTVGAATAKLMAQPALVDFAVEWFERNRH